MAKRRAARQAPRKRAGPISVKPRVRRPPLAKLRKLAKLVGVPAAAFGAGVTAKALQAKVVAAGVPTGMIQAFLAGGPAPNVQALLVQAGVPVDVVRKAGAKLSALDIKTLMQRAKAASKQALGRPPERFGFGGKVLAPDLPGGINKRQAVTSSWVRAIELVNSTLVIEFKDGFRALYPGTTPADFDRMAAAPSKGKHVWAEYYHRDYGPADVASLEMQLARLAK